MALVTVPPFIYPFWNPAYDTFAAVTLQATIDATTDRYGLLFQAPKTGTLERMEFYVAAGTSLGALKAGWQGVSLTTGFPDNAWTHWSDITGYAVGWQATTGYFGSGGSSSGSRRSVTKGELLAFVVSPENATTPNITVRTHDYNILLTSFPRPVQITSGSSWALGTDPLTLSLWYQGESNPTMIGNGSVTWPLHSFTIINASTSGANRYLGNKFQVPFACRVCGAYMAMDGDASVDLRLIGPLGTDMITDGGTGLNISSNLPAGATVMIPYQMFHNPVTLEANTDYRSIVRTVVSTNVGFQAVDVPSAAHGSAAPGGLSWGMCNSSTGGVGTWTDSATRRLVGGIIIDQINDGLSAA